MLESLKRTKYTSRSFTGGTIGEVSVEWYPRIVQSNATKDQDYIADGAVMVFEQGINRRGEFQLDSNYSNT